MSEEGKPDHDGGYQGLFSHREFVKDMLQAALEPVLIEGLDLDGMERVNTKYISDKLERRVGDVVWRIPYGEAGVLYLCLMLEFQSRDEKWITTRILAYQGHLYQQTLEEQKPGKGHDRVLPLLLPLVLYNGDEPWTAPRRLSELMNIDESSPMWRYQPECCYILIDEKRFPVVSDGESLFVTLCELEACQNRQQLEVLLNHLRTQLREPRYAALRRSFAAWLQLALLPPKGFHLDSPTTYNLDEVIEMTTVNIPAQIEKNALDKGEKIGLDKGELQRLRRSIGRVYERRFGDVPRALQERIEETSEMALLEAWFDIVIIETPQDIAQRILARNVRDPDRE